jgi:aminotransferase
MEETQKNRSAIAATGKKFRTDNISKRVQKIVISPIKEMSILADEFEDKNPGADIVSFGQGIPYFDTYPYIKDGIRAALQEIDTSKYTLEPGITELRMLVGDFLMREKSATHVQAKKEIMIGVGCQEVVACALASLIDEGDEALIISPAFASHIEQVIQWGGTPVLVPLKESEGWHFDIAEAEKRITEKTKVILFSNPSNPTGKVFLRGELQNIADIAKKHDLVVISDETYDFLTYEKKSHVSMAEFHDIRDRVIVCGSFSKKYALTGYRVGYGFADEGIIDHMLKVHDALAICAPAISQKAAITALKGPKEFVTDAVQKFSANRLAMMSELDTLPDIFSYQKPEGAYYILVNVKIPNVDSFKLALKILHEAQVIVIPGAAFGAEGENHLRFSFACPPENISKGFERLRAWAERWKKENYAL